MKRLTEQQIVEAMQHAYLRRLHEVLGETDTRDSRGNVTIPLVSKCATRRPSWNTWTSLAQKDPGAFAQRVNKRAGKNILESRELDRWALLAGIGERK